MKHTSNVTNDNKLWKKYFRSSLYQFLKSDWELTIPIQVQQVFVNLYHPQIGCRTLTVQIVWTVCTAERMHGKSYAKIFIYLLNLLIGIIA